jgi:hypothetical protein
MIRTSPQKHDPPAVIEDFGTTRRHSAEEDSRIIETEYFCGCKSHDPHAPERCMIHGDPIRLTRILSFAYPRYR